MPERHHFDIRYHGIESVDWESCERVLAASARRTALEGRWWGVRCATGRSSVMLGWGIYIYGQLPGESPEESGSRNGEELVWWMTGYKGLDWIEKLVKEGKVESLGGNGYPFRFTTIAKHVLPRLLSGPPAVQTPPVIGEDYCLPRDWGGKATFNHKRIAECRPDDPLVIEAWDQS